MSSNKLKYYKVTRSFVVQANSKTDAQIIATNRKVKLPGRVLSEGTEVEHIYANEAHSMING